MDPRFARLHNARSDATTESTFSSSLAVASATAQPLQASPDRQSLRDTRVPAFLHAGLTTHMRGPVNGQRGEHGVASMSNANDAAPATRAAAAAAAPASINTVPSPNGPSLFYPLSMGSPGTPALASNANDTATTAPHHSTPPTHRRPVLPPEAAPPREAGLLPGLPSTAAAQGTVRSDGADGAHHRHAAPLADTAAVAAAATLSTPHIAVVVPLAFQFIHVPHTQPSSRGARAAVKTWDGDGSLGTTNSPTAVAVDRQQQQQQRSRADTVLTASSPTSSGARQLDEAADRSASARPVSYAVHRVLSRTRHPLFHTELPPLYTQSTALSSTTTATDLGSSRSRRHSTMPATTMPVFGSARQDKQPWHSSPLMLRGRYGTSAHNSSGSSGGGVGGGVASESLRSDNRLIHSGDSGSGNHTRDREAAACASAGGAGSPAQPWPSQPGSTNPPLALSAFTSPTLSPSPPTPPLRGCTGASPDAGVPPAGTGISWKRPRLSAPDLQSNLFIGSGSGSGSGGGGVRPGPVTAPSKTTGVPGDGVEGATLTSPLELGAARAENEGRQPGDRHLPHPSHHAHNPGSVESPALSVTWSSGRSSGDGGGAAALYAAGSPRRARAALTPSFIAAAAVKPGVFGGPDTSLVSLLSPLQQQFAQAQHVAAAVAVAGGGGGGVGPGAGGAAGLGSSGAVAAAAARCGFHLRDLRRGTWVFALAREECIAREGIEAAETTEALQGLPASWKVWRSCLPPDSDSDDVETVEENCLSEAYATGTSAPSQAVTSAPPSSSTSPMQDIMATTSAFSGTVGSEHSAASIVRRSPDVGPCRAFSRLHITLPSACVAAAAHPALVAAVHRLTLLEGLRRDEIVEEEAAEHRAEVARPLVYERRLLTVGTLPLENFLRRWIARRRSRGRRHAHALAQLVAREAEARVDLHATSQTLQRRFGTMLIALLEEEHRYRTTVELLWVQDAAWTGVVLLRLNEQVVRFPLAYGGRMSRTRACGRVEGLTRFHNLALAEEATRAAIARDEAVERARWPVAFALQVLCYTAEPQARAALGAAEVAERADVEQVLRALETHYTLREVVIEESMSRQSWLLGGQRRDGAVGGGGGDGVSARRLSPSPRRQAAAPSIDVEL